MVEQGDPLWLGLCCAAGLSAVAFVVLLMQTRTPALQSPWQQLFFVPLMAVGFARRVRREGGNVTERAREVFSREPTPGPRHYSRAFALWALGLYAFAIVVAVASYGLSPSVWVFVGLQGAITVYVISHAAFGTAVVDRGSDVDS